MNNFMKKAAFALTTLTVAGGAYASPMNVLDVSDLSATTVGQGMVILKSTQSEGQQWFGLDLSNDSASDVDVAFTLDHTDAKNQTVSYTLYSLPAGVTSFDPSDPSGVLGSPYKPSFSLTNAPGGVSSLSLMLMGGVDYLLNINVGSGSSFTGINSLLSTVPLPGAALLFGTALLGAGALRRRGRKGREADADGAIAAA